MADLLIGSFALPTWIYQVGLGILWHPRISHHEVIAFIAIDTFTSLASISNLTAISMERLYATLFPLQHRATSKARFRLFVVVVWTLPAVTSVFYIFASFVVLSALGTLCTWLPYLCLLLLVICTSYTAVFYKMRSRIHGRLDRDRKLTVTLFIATTLSLVAYLPMVVLGVLYFVLGKSMKNRFLNVLSFANFGNSLVNPILYSFRMPNFRRAACSLCCTHRPQRPKHPGPGTIPQTDNCVSPLSVRMTGPAKFPESVASGAPTSLASPRIERFKGPGYRGKVSSPKSTQTCVGRFVTDMSPEQSHSPNRIRTYPNRETSF